MPLLNVSASPTRTDKVPRDSLGRSIFFKKHRAIQACMDALVPGGGLVHAGRRAAQRIGRALPLKFQIVAWMAFLLKVVTDLSPKIFLTILRGMVNPVLPFGLLERRWLRASCLSGFHWTIALVKVKRV